MPEIEKKHLSDDELEKAVAAGAARVVFERPKFRIVIHDGLRYLCNRVSFVCWAKAAGNSSSDYRGTKDKWLINKVEPDTGYQKNVPAPAKQFRSTTSSRN